MKKATLALFLMAVLSEQAVEGVKLDAIAYGEPPAKSLNKGDVEDKSDKEKEEQ